MSARVRDGAVLQRALGDGRVIPVEGRVYLRHKVGDLDLIDVRPCGVAASTIIRDQSCDGLRVNDSHLLDARLDKENFHPGVFRQAVCENGPRSSPCRETSARRLGS